MGGHRIDVRHHRGDRVNHCGRARLPAVDPCRTHRAPAEADALGILCARPPRHRILDRSRGHSITWSSGNARVDHRVGSNCAHRALDVVRRPCLHGGLARSDRNNRSRPRHPVYVLQRHQQIPGPAPLPLLLSPLLRLPGAWLWGTIGGSLGRRFATWRGRPVRA